jgi:hypothetical protein
MKTTEKTKEILTNCRNTFKCLNYALGFDFEKPALIFEGSGHFTLKGLKKIATDAGINTETAAMCVIIHKITSYNDNFRMVKIQADFNGFDLLESCDLGFFNGDHLDGYWRKSDFETDRKDDTTTFYLICQNKEFLQPAKKEIKIDFAERVKVIDKYHFQQNGKTKYIGEPRFYYRGQDRTRIFDKSGYLLNDIRDNLTRKAAKIRADKEKAAASVYSTAEATATIKARYEQLKKAISAKLLAEEIDIVYSVMFDFKWLTGDIRNFETKTQKNGYNSIKEIKEAIANINKRIDAIFTKIA